MELHTLRLRARRARDGADVTAAFVEIIISVWGHANLPIQRGRVACLSIVESDDLGGGWMRWWWLDKQMAPIEYVHIV